MKSNAMIYDELQRFLDTDEANVWRVVSDNPFIGLCICDAAGTILHVNALHEQIIGLPRDEVIGKNMRYFEESGYIDNSTTLDIITDSKSFLREQTLSSDKQYLVSSDPIFDHDGKLAYIVSQLLDISLEHNLKRQLNQTRQVNRLMQKNIATYKDMIKTFEDPIAGESPMLYTSKKMKDIFTLIQHIETSDSTVLITGESGVGKELVARTIHMTSTRKEMSFIDVNCAAIPASLLESELFGYSAGAFTGGNAHGKIGLFEAAKGGTLFLDEIGELTPELQAKLLRVLQENIIRPIGATDSIPVDVRIVAATNRNLHQLVGTGGFRKDLFYRLNVIPLNVPPLRERREDIPLLSYYFLEKFNRKYNKEKTLSLSGLHRLMVQPFDGNVRQLENTIERLVLLSSDNELIDQDILNFYSLAEVAHTDEFETEASVPENRPALNKGSIAPDTSTWKEKRRKDEEQTLLEMKRSGMNTYQIAAALGINQSTVWRKLKKIDGSSPI
jgi:PAS domain S-box-containing protein